MFFGTVVGIDVSEAMLMCASVSENVTLYCIDITKVSLAETFDVVTAFRFFLNAEDSLRREALRAIYRRLREGGCVGVQYPPECDVAHGLGQSCPELGISENTSKHPDSGSVFERSERGGIRDRGYEVLRLSSATGPALSTSL